jgi:hypothetical protein
MLLHVPKPKTTCTASRNNAYVLSYATDQGAGVWPNRQPTSLTVPSTMKCTVNVTPEKLSATSFSTAGGGKAHIISLCFLCRVELGQVFGSWGIAATYGTNIVQSSIVVLMRGKQQCMKVQMAPWRLTAPGKAAGSWLTLAGTYLHPLADHLPVHTCRHHVKPSPLPSTK